MKQEKGQAVLIVLLVAAVALVFGLSIISQSTTDIRISQHENEAARAFNAAEAGIEDALKNMTIGSFEIPVGDITVNYQVTGENVLEGVYKENDTATVILGGADPNLSIEWGETNAVCPGAASLEITVIAADGSIVKYGTNACNINNGMTVASLNGSGDYLKKFVLAVSGTDRLVRIRPIYNQTKIRVIGANLPTQAYQVNSEAQSPSLESKAISVSRTEPAAPAIFDYVLFSGTNVVK